MTRGFSDEVIEGSLSMRGFSSPPSVSASGYGSIHFDASLGKYRISESGGAYQDMGTVRSVGITAPAAGITASGTVTSSGSITLALANDLAALEGLSGTGLAQRTGVDSWALVSQAALTKSDDTNVTLTLGGTPTTALLAAVSITAGWTGTLAMPRGGTGQSTCAMGDMLYASTTNTWAKLGILGAGYILAASSGGIPEWIQAVTATHGGTAQTSYAQGDTLYASATNTLAKLTIGTAGQVLTVGGGNVPVWQTPSTWGTVTSVNVTSSDLSVGGSGYTTTGTITLTLNTVSAAKGGTGLTSYTAGDMLYASGTTTLGKVGIGSSGQVLAVFGGAPAWITLSSTTSSFAATRFDTSGSVAGIALANRATGLTNTGVEWYCPSAGEAHLYNYNSLADTFVINGSGYVTTGQWRSTAVAAAYGGTGLTSYAVGDTLYADSSTSLAKLAGNTTTTKKFLTQTGTGSASQAPVWTSPVTGWAAQSCSLSRTLLCGGSATLDNLSQVLSTLINDLRSFGVITT